MDKSTVSKIKLGAILLMTIVPITLASFAFRAAMESGSLFGTANKGHLIMPPADVTDLDMRDEEGVLQFLSFEERLPELGAPGDYVPQPWLLVYATGRSCDSICMDRIFYLRQMHATFGRDTRRVRRYYLHSAYDPISEEIRDQFREEYPSMGLSFGDRERIERQMADSGVELDLQNESYVFFVDPVGNVMMYYDSSHDITDIKEDLERLLSQSSLG